MQCFGAQANALLDIIIETGEQCLACCYRGLRTFQGEVIAAIANNNPKALFYQAQVTV